MRKLLLMALLMSSQAKAIEPDKWKHFGLMTVGHPLCSWVVGSALHLEEDERWQTRIFCAVGLFGVGRLKEGLDKISRGAEDQGDNLANDIGLATGAVISWRLRF